MARSPIDDPQVHRQQWGRLDPMDRRRIMRAVNRGQALDRRKEAALAVGVARQQQRFWRKVWLAGPLIALLQWNAGWLAVVINAVIGLAVVGGMALFWLRRARRAEQANLERVGRSGDGS